MVRDAFKLSKQEEKYLLGYAKREGVYFAKGIHIPMKVIASPLEHTLATTNPREVAASLAMEEVQEEHSIIKSRGVEQGMLLKHQQKVRKKCE